MRSPGLDLSATVYLFEQRVVHKAGLAAGLYQRWRTAALGRWPLPALADGCALHAARTKASLQSGQRTLKKLTLKPFFDCAL
ncbi:MAG: hypothetical protein EBS88_09530 [Betaproteobacteria bacterium]|nr:hypothetical protein [Betaproteobacteria bacterium]